MTPTEGQVVGFVSFLWGVRGVGVGEWVDGT